MPKVPPHLSILKPSSVKPEERPDAGQHRDKRVRNYVTHTPAADDQACHACGTPLAGFTFTLARSTRGGAIPTHTPMCPSRVWYIRPAHSLVPYLLPEFS